MPLVQESYDSLPYIDAEPTIEQRAAAQALIDAELSDATDLHSLIPSLPSSTLTPILDAELERVSLKKPISGIDLSRYEALEPPQTTPHSDKNSPESLDLWRSALSSSYISHEYLAGRAKHLNELNTDGKDEWLAGNEALVGILKGLEEELAKTKEQIDLVVVGRQREQAAVEGELKVLEEGWKRGVGRTLETEVAAEELRSQILQAMRDVGPSQT